jgi:hypothetical protein
MNQNPYGPPQQQQQHNPYVPPSAQMGYGGPRQPLKPHRGSMILVFGILGLLVCLIFGILAWVFGNQDLREMDAGVMDPEGRDLTNVGRILGMVACGLAIAGLVIYAVVMIFFAARF